MADVDVYKLDEKNCQRLFMYLRDDRYYYDKLQLTHHENGVSYYILEGGKHLVFDQKNRELITMNISERLKTQLGYIMNGC